MDHIGGQQSGLRQTRRIKVIATADPEHRTADVARFARSDAGEEQGGGSVIGKRACPACDLVQCSRSQTTTGKAVIERADAERHGPVIGQRNGDRA